MLGQFRVRFEPGGQIFKASAPVDLFLAAASCDILVEQPCGARTTCGRCRVRVLAGTVRSSEADERLLTAEERNAGWRLGCQLVLDRSATIEIPPVARSTAAKSFGGDVRVDEAARVLTARRVQVPEATLDRQEADIDRLAAALGGDRRAVGAAPAALIDLAAALRRGADVGVVMEGDELLSATAEGPASWLGLALDVGSTSLAAALVDLGDGRVHASASLLNPQVAFGPDIISRIQHAIEHPDGTRHLTAAVRRGLAELVDDVMRRAAAPPARILAASVAGNPTMMHTWLGVGVEPLGHAPYVGTWSQALRCRARDVELPIHPNAAVYCFPLIRSHVGADTVSAAMACGLDEVDRPTLLVDLGTNSEVVVAAKGRVVATSTAAGPAFEGATIHHGLRASPGAIDAVTIMPDGRLLTKTVGALPPRGLCGSGLIDAVAELRRAGIIDTTGGLASPDQVHGRVPAALVDRLTTVGRQRAFVLNSGGPHTGTEVVLTARDVRQLQLAKGSILAGITLVCRRFGIDIGDLDQVLLAGAFGTYVRKASIVAIGLTPPVDPERVRFVGNAAGIGARLALLDRRVRQRAEALAAQAEYLELAGHPDYEAAFMDALGFPA